MAVLIEAISVVIRRKAITEKFVDGWEGFQRIVPNNTLCFDDDLIRVGFMSPQDVKAFVYQLEELGLTFLQGDKAIDFAVVDQLHGPTIECEWLVFSSLNIQESHNNKIVQGKVAVCWLLEGRKIPVAGLHMPTNWKPGDTIALATPDWWTYKGSLSEASGFVAHEEMKERMKFLYHEDGVDVYLDLRTGEKKYIGRTPSR